MFDWSWWPSRIPSLYGRLKTLESKLIQEKKWGRSVESVMIQISTICFGLVHITWGILILEVFQHLQIFICIRKQKKKKGSEFSASWAFEIFLEYWLWSIYELTETESLLWRGACLCAPRRSLFIDSKLPKNFISFKFQAKARNEMNLIFRADFPLIFFRRQKHDWIRIVFWASFECSKVALTSVLTLDALNPWPQF